MILAVRISSALAILGSSACIVDREAGIYADEETTAAATTGGSVAESETTSADDGPTVKLDFAEFDLAVEECASVMQTSTIFEGPSDILIVVDHRVSYDEARPTFQNFSLLIGNDLIEDVRVVMLAGYPSEGGGVCIDERPLGTGDCPTSDDNPPMYHHVDEVIAADTLLDQVVDTYDLWGPSMRPDAWKHIWVVSGADASMPTDEFVAAFEALDPSHERMTFHAMVPNVTEADCSLLLPDTLALAAPAYIELAAATGGVFEPLCNYNVGELFDALLDEIQEVALSCSYDIPAPPEGHVFEQDRVNVDYDDGSGLETIGYVASVSDCAGVSDGWYYDDVTAPEKVLMCPQTCAGFDDAGNASIELRFGCATIPAG
jgi:hypothetical protein